MSGLGSLGRQVERLCGRLRAETGAAPRADELLAYLEQPAEALRAAADEIDAAPERAALPAGDEAQLRGLGALPLRDGAPRSLALAAALRRAPALRARLGGVAELLAALPGRRGEVARIEAGAAALRARASDARLLLRAVQAQIHDGLLAWRERKLSQLPEGDPLRPLIERELAEVVRLAARLAEPAPRQRAARPAPLRLGELLRQQAAALLDEAETEVAAQEEGAARGAGPWGPAEQPADLGGPGRS